MLIIDSLNFFSCFSSFYLSRKINKLNKTNVLIKVPSIVEAISEDTAYFEFPNIAVSRLEKRSNRNIAIVGKQAG